MRHISITALLFIANYFSAHSQELLKHKWHRFVMGGEKGYFVKTSTFTTTTMTENQFGSGGPFDNSPTDIKLADVYTTPTDERVIADYGDSSYYVFVFKNFTAENAMVYMHSRAFKTVEEAKAFVPDDSQFSAWLTEAGYKAENKKPAIPVMTKKDVLVFVSYFATTAQKIKEATASSKPDDKASGRLAIALLMSVIPAKYAESKGYNGYKSIPVIEQALKKYRNDADVKNILKSAGLTE